jgi:hyperosmotically inducible protein
MTRLIPTLCLSGLLLACARDHKPDETARAETAGHEQRAEGRHGRSDERAEARASDEQVELKHRDDQGRMASRGELPARDPGNSAVNDRDRDGAEITPLDQGNDEIDIELTQRIRKSVVGDDSLSFSAKNVKIITRDGHVTLRGTVNSAAEKETIFKTAITHAGVGHVTNQLEVDE